MKIICKNGHIFERKDMDYEIVSDGLYGYWRERCPVCGSDELREIDEEDIKKLKAMEKRVTKRITEPE